MVISNYQFNVYMHSQMHESSNIVIYQSHYTVPVGLQPALVHSIAAE